MPQRHADDSWFAADVRGPSKDNPTWLLRPTLGSNLGALGAYIVRMPAEVQAAPQLPRGILGWEVEKVRRGCGAL